MWTLARQNLWRTVWKKTCHSEFWPCKLWIFELKYLWESKTKLTKQISSVINILLRRNHITIIWHWVVENDFDAMVLKCVNYRAVACKQTWRCAVTQNEKYFFNFMREQNIWNLQDRFEKQMCSTLALKNRFNNYWWFTLF